jgi:hypothetical protein
MSLRLIEGLHARWTALLRSMAPEDWQRTFVHPERGEMNLEVTARIYAWHCDHHLAHIRIAAEHGRRETAQGSGLEEQGFSPGFRDRDTS